MKKLLEISRAAKAAQSAEQTCYYNDLNKNKHEGLQNCMNAINADVATLSA